MEKKVLIIATVQSHIGQFHKPLMKLLKEHGWEIHVAARNNLAEKNGLQLEYPDKVFDIPFQRSPLSPRNLEAYKQLKKLLRENHYDVIHCNTPVGGMLGRLAAKRCRKAGTQVYYTAHGFHFYEGAPKQNWLIYYPIEKWMSRFTDKLITITEEDYQLAMKKFHCPVVRMHGVGADEKRFHVISDEQKETIRQKLNVEGNPIIMNVGELLPNKNQKTIIAAMPAIIEKYPDAKLYIAGNGSEEKSLKAQAVSLGLDKHVQFLGYTREVNLYTQISDVLVSCSYREGMPLNVMEAMLCGKPVVASRNRGHNELIAEGTTGHLVSPDDSDGFAKAVCKVLKNPAAYSEVAMERVKPYTYQSVVQELTEIYGIK